MRMDNKIFREQIQEDIKLIQDKLSWDANIKKDEYAFNYWVLSNIYNLDEETCNDNITEYNDKGIDCFVHFEEDKELYIIQNKYYADDTPLNSRELSDFLTRPLATLNKGDYKRSLKLQNIYSKAKKDDAYKIFLHFYLTNDKKTEDLKNVINDFKQNQDNDVFFDFFYLSDIKEKYYGKSFKENSYLTTQLTVKNKGTYLAVRPKEYGLPNMSEAYYVMAKVTGVYNIWKEAKDKDYPLFEENIREYLGGTSGINKGIIQTLKDPKERGNFFYYNNGITIICDKAKADAKKVEIENPQIVNGCQTVSSIAEHFKTVTVDNKKDYEHVYVMAKILVVEEKDTNFYRDVVKYTNSQNAINDKVFAATLKPFFTIQKTIEKLGFLVPVKQSDRHQFKERYKESKAKGILLNTAKTSIPDNFYDVKRITDVQISLENLIQIIGAYLKDAYFAYTKKSSLLKPTSTEYYQNFSRKIGEFLTTESMVKLILLFKKAEFDRKSSEDKRTPMPYYLLNFIGFYLETQNIDKQEFLKQISKEDLKFVYEKFKPLSSKYTKKYEEKIGFDYNKMIQQKVDTEIMQEVLKGMFEGLEEHNKADYQKLTDIFQKIKDES